MWSLGLSQVETCWFLRLGRQRRRRPAAKTHRATKAATTTTSCCRPGHLGLHRGPPRRWIDPERVMRYNRPPFWWAASTRTVLEEGEASAWSRISLLHGMVQRDSRLIDVINLRLISPVTAVNARSTSNLNSSIGAHN
jgi:hypothetical protein